LKTEVVVQKERREICPFCKDKREAEVREEIVSEKTGGVVGRAEVCRECLEKLKKNEWFIYKEEQNERDM